MLEEKQKHDSDYTKINTNPICPKERLQQFTTIAIKKTQKY